MAQRQLTNVLAAALRGDCGEAYSQLTDLSQRELNGLPGLAERHGIAGYLYHCFSQAEDLESRLSAAFGESFRRSMGVHMRSVADLERLQPVMIGAGIPWMLIQGAAVIESIYGRADLRSSNTVEVLAQPDSADVLADVLGRAGCRVIDPGRDRGAATRALGAILWHGTMATFVQRVRPVGTSPCIPPEELLARGRRAVVGSASMLLPDPSDLSVVLAAMVGSSQVPLGIVKDLERLITLGRIEWAALVDRAERWEMADAVWRGLLRAHRVLGVSIPDPVKDDLRRAQRTSRHVPDAIQRPIVELRHHTPAEAALLDLASIHPSITPGLEPQAWRQILSMARRERMCPLVYEAILKTDPGTPPAAIHEALSEERQIARTHVEAALSQLTPLLRALQRTGVEAVVLKGAAAAVGVYSEAALRPFTDLDLLVRLDEVPRAHATLTELGYRVEGGSPSGADLVWRHARAYRDPTGHRYSIDLHWRYTGYPLLIPLDYAGVFARASTAPIEGSMRIPSGADMIVGSAIYLAREVWYRRPRLRYLRDIAELVSRREVDWDIVSRIAHETPLIRTPLLAALTIARTLLDAPVPNKVAGGAGSSSRTRTLLFEHLRLNVLRSETALAGMIQTTIMRWLDNPSPSALASWIGSLLVVPPPLAGSQKRWARTLRREVSSGASIER